MKMTAEALLVRQSGQPHHGGIAECATREERQCGRFAPDLIQCVVHIGQELDLGDGQQVVVGHA